LKSFFGLDDESDNDELLSKNLNDDIAIDPDFVMSTDVYKEDEQLLVQSANEALCTFFKMNNDEDAKLLFQSLNDSYSFSKAQSAWREKHVL